ncbi:IgGFc-binding protein-like [Liolophura sinensis]|uniref:IgGFc-binding protein-like n=1 Tax=Liolophura sinensis TaxID=3198878 RepID=UPI0031592F7D
MGIECRTVNTQTPWNETEDTLSVPCTPEGGIVCINKNQPDKLCEDYEIRLQCPPDQDECLDGTAKCDENADCFNIFGGFECKCRNGFVGDGFDCYEGARCRVYGDPHIVSFDNRKFDYQGVCKYRLAEPCYDVGGVPNFQVINKNRFIGYTGKKTPLSQARNVFVEVYGFKILMEQNLVVIIDDVEITVPKRFEPASLDWPGSYLEIKPHIYGLELVTDFGLRVLFDGERKVEIQVPSTVKSHMCGLCGNYDGKWRNDFRKLDGTVVDWLSATEFGDSWGVKDDDPRCVQKTPPPESCSQESILRATERCKLITDESGPFAECLTTLGEEAMEYQESCVYDMCSMVDDDTLLCPSFEAFAMECEVKGHIVNWRTKDRCPMNCPVNMHYKASGTACKPSCFGLRRTFTLPRPTSRWLLL